MVIGLQSTGEANTTQVRETQGDAMDDFVSAPRQIMQGFLENHFPMRAGQLDMSDSSLEALHSLVSHELRGILNRSQTLLLHYS